MGVNSLPKTVTRQRRGCDLNPGPTAPESSTLRYDTIRYDTRCYFNVRSKADMNRLNLLHGVKGKVFPYSLPSVGPGADPGVQAVSPQVT